MLQYFNINFAHLWCTIAPRWFPTKEKRQKRMWSEILLQVQVKKKRGMFHVVVKWSSKTNRSESQCWRRWEQMDMKQPILYVNVWPTVGSCDPHGKPAHDWMIELFNLSYHKKKKEKKKEAAGSVTAGPELNFDR